MHRTVLLNETIEGLHLSDGCLVLDATFGGGGHSRAILEKFPKVKVIALDQDETAWDKAKGKFKGLEERIFFVNLNFRNLDIVYSSPAKNFFETAPSETKGPACADLPFAEGLGKAMASAGRQGIHTFLKNSLPGSSESPVFDAIIFDLGVSSDQLENSGRGFSFLKDEPLLMTLKANSSPEDLTAKDVVNNWSEENLADIIYGYGEERWSRKIARGIVEARQNGEIRTTGELTGIVEKSVPVRYRKGRIHPATRTFQAIRIAVNDELRALEEGLTKGFEVLKKEGRMAVVSFHSLEDRVVKRFYQNKEREGEAKLVNKKPITPSGEEIRENRRSRSGKLRILEKVK